MNPYYIHDVLSAETTLDPAADPGLTETKRYMEKLPHMALYNDPRLSDKEMTAIYNEKCHAYWVEIESGHKAVYMVLDTMNLNNLHPHPENNYFYEISSIAVES